MKESIRNIPRSKVSFLEGTLDLEYVGSGGAKSDLYRDKNTGELFHKVPIEKRKSNRMNSFNERIIPMLTKGIINSSDTVWDEKTQAFYHHEQKVDSVEKQSRLEFDIEFEADWRLFIYIFGEGMEEKVLNRSTKTEVLISKVMQDKWKKVVPEQSNVMTNRAENKKYYYDFSDALNFGRLATDFQDRREEYEELVKRDVETFLTNDYYKDIGKKIILLLQQKVGLLLARVEDVKFFTAVYKKATENKSDSLSILDEEKLRKELLLRLSVMQHVISEKLSRQNNQNGV